MSTRAKDAPQAGGIDTNARFYLIYDQVHDEEGQAFFDVSAEEIDEIEQIRRMVLEVGEEAPIFMTSS